jgi:hypothetical protein
VALISNALIVYRLQNVPGLDASLIRGASRHNDTSLDAVGQLNPRCAVIGWNITALLLDVERAQNEHSDRKQDCSDVLKGKDLASHLIAH